jgi:hypothetical protein
VVDADHRLPERGGERDGLDLEPVPGLEDSGLLAPANS